MERGNRAMGKRYCPYCHELVEVKVKQVNSSYHKTLKIPVKKRVVIHRKEDGGCGSKWHTIEIEHF